MISAVYIRNFYSYGFLISITLTHMQVLEHGQRFIAGRRIRVSFIVHQSS